MGDDMAGTGGAADVGGEGPAHGTRSRYTAGCRCDDCRRANTDYMMRWLANRKVEVPTAAAGQRVRDLATGDYGSVVAGPYPNGRWQVAWDRPTPHQETARVTIPSRFFAWAEEPAASGPKEDDRAR